VNTSIFFDSASKQEEEIFSHFVANNPKVFQKELIAVWSSRVSEGVRDWFEIRIELASSGWDINIMSNSVSAFRASLNHLRGLLEGEMESGVHRSEAAFEIRGVIEGFYGKPWSHEQRLKGLQYFADCNMNHFMLAPKDDPWQRFDWRVPFKEEFLNQVQILHKSAELNGITLSVSLSPGLTVSYSDPNDVKAIMVRYEQLYKVGVRHFGLLVDDIPWELQHEEDIRRFASIADAHASYANEIYSQLQKIESGLRLSVCPLVYRGRGTEPYIVTLGNSLAGAIDLMWTGRQICSEYLDSVDAIAFKKTTSKRPFYWDNYPVNDVGMINELHVGPITGRQADLGEYSAGLLANPMDRFELSLIAIGTIGDYLWDSKNYDSEKSWFTTMKRLVQNTEDREAISRVFRCSFGSCLAQAQAPEFSAMLDSAKYAWRTKSMELGLQILTAAANEMRADVERILSPDFSMNEWRSEALPWIKKYGDGEKALRGIIEVLSSAHPTKEGRLSAPAGSREKIWEIWNSLAENQTRLFGDSFILFVGELAAEIADRN